MTMMPCGGGPLSQAEREALRLSANGMVVAEVARVMRTPADLVRERLASATTKLGAHSKLEAVHVALKRGVIDLPPPER